MSRTAHVPPSVSWVGRMLAIHHARFPVGHSIRSALCVGGPFVVGAVLGNIMMGMWIGLGCLLMSPGEREGSHRLNLRIQLISIPIATCGYFLGFVQHLSVWVLVPIMALLAFVCGVLPAYGAPWSVAGMQFLLIAALGIGVEGADWWEAIWCYLAGGVLYVGCMLVEFAFDRRRPERVTLHDVVARLGALAAARGAELRSPTVPDGAGHPATSVTSAPGGAAAATATARAAALAAVAAARTVLVTGRSTSGSRARHWDLLARALDDAESLVALVVGTQQTAELDCVQGRLARLVSRSSASIRTNRPTHATGLLNQRLSDFELTLAELGLGFASTTQVRADAALHARPAPSLSAARAGAGATAGAALRRRWWERFVVGPDALAFAGRLALCYAIAVAARAYDPFNHWFWVPLTVTLVMKPDFGSVFDRAILRVLGTAIGVGVSALVILLVPRGWPIGIAIGVLAFWVPWFMMMTYTLQAVAIAPIVILLVDVIQPHGSADYGTQRIVATAIGGAIVIVFGYLVWPSARRPDLRGRLARATGALADYVRSAGASPTGPADAVAARHAAIVSDRRTAYATLADARTQLQRELGEAPPACIAAAEWIPAVSAIERATDGVDAYALARAEGRDGRGEAEVAGIARDAAALARLGEPEPTRRAALALYERITTPQRAPE